MAKPRDEGANGAQHPSAFQRIIERVVGGNAPLGCDDDPARQKWPKLWQWLSTTRIPNTDYVVQPATISVGLGPTGVLATLTWRDLTYSVPCSCLHLEQVFQTFEDALADPNCVLRTFGKSAPRLRTRKKS